MEPTIESANDNLETDGDQLFQDTQCNSKGKRLKSNVWENMTRIMTPDSIDVECNHCKKCFKANPTNGTSYLKRHIDKCAARKYHDMKNFCITGSGSTTASDSETANPMTMHKLAPNLDAIREAIGVYFISCALPFSQVESAGFKYFMSVITPQWKPLSRMTIQRDAMQYYNNLKLDVAKELQDAPGSICFTTDNWRSEHNIDEYMCLTAHWIDKKWKLQKRIIKFAALTSQLDGASLADEILLCLGEWKISEKVFSFTLDNASYNDTMVASLRSHLLRKHSLVLNGEFFHIRCSCHIINLVVHAGLKIIDDAVVKIRRVVTCLRHSLPKNKKFYEVASTNFGLSTAMKLRLDTPTRWNSTYTMLDRYIYF
ncbi:hypothetical protein QQ045_033283 [Rhodiola kirilowii]